LEQGGIRLRPVHVGQPFGEFHCTYMLDGQDRQLQFR
jgi:hypothetical protein